MKKKNASDDAVVNGVFLVLYFRYFVHASFKFNAKRSSVHWNVKYAEIRIRATRCCYFSIL